MDNTTQQDETHHDEKEATTPPSTNMLLSILLSPFHFIVGVYNLFFNRKFMIHRIGGLIYLIQYASIVTLYFVAFDRFQSSFLIWSMPLNGLIQSISAMYTFTFLPKRTLDPGYYGDKGVLSYNFIVENSFFEVLLLFQWLYYHPTFHSFFQHIIIPEIIFVFLPYAIRPLWPKTSFRDALKSDKNKSPQNKAIFVAATWVTKIFYIWAKHFIGYFLNYVRFLDRVDDQERQAVYFTLIFGSFATTISLFLHTLRFKHYISGITSYGTYMASYLGTFYGFYLVSSIFIKNTDLTLIVLLGIVLNFTNHKIQILYQVLVMALLYGEREGYNSLGQLNGLLSGINIGGGSIGVGGVVRENILLK